MSHCGRLLGAMTGEHLSRPGDLLTGNARGFAEFGRKTTAADSVAAIAGANRVCERSGLLPERFAVFVCPTAALPAPLAEHELSRDRPSVGGCDVDPAPGWCINYPFNTLRH